MANPIFLDRGEAHRRIVELGRRFGFEVDPEAKVGSLSVGWQQRVEILKALYRDAKILVLDEPTAVLTPQETEEIFEVLRRLAAGGHSIVFISHKLYEVLEIADRITVIRRGKVVGQRIPSETNEEDLAELMVGREVSLTVDRGESHPAEPVARDPGPDSQRRARLGGRPRGRPGDPCRRDPGHRRGRRQRPGRARRGARRAAPTDRRARSRSTARTSPGNASRDGLRRGRRVRAGRPAPLRAGAPVLDRRQPRPDVATTAAVRAGAAAQRRRDPRDGRRPDPASSTSARRRPTRRAATLSGGNQQKVVVAREFARDLRLLVLDQPTRGLDVGSIEFIHRQAIAKRDAGTAILLVSAELDEVLELSDRIAVIYRGKLVAHRRRPNGRQERGRPPDGDRRAAKPRRRRDRSKRPAARRRDRRMSRRRARLGDRRAAGHLDRACRSSSARWSSSSRSGWSPGSSTRASRSRPTAH